MTGWMGKLILLLILQTLTSLSIAVTCEENECCVIGSANRSYVINCNESPVFRRNWSIQCGDSRIWVSCSSEVTNGGIRGESNDSNCAKNLDRIDFYNCSFPNKTFYDAIRTLSTSMNITTVSFTSDQTRRVYIEGRQLYHFPELRTLNLYRGGISLLVRDMLRHVPRLEDFNLSSNSITEMNSRFFIYTTKLKRVDLGFNEISYIDLSLFRDVPDLRFLSLESNKLTDLSEEMFVRLIRLEHLNIGKNKLKTLPARLFGTLRSLRRLNMSENEFSSLPSDLLANNSDLEECYLSNNRGNLTSLPEAMFGNLSYLRILGLEGNKLVELPENSFWGSYNLTKLNLTGNALVELPENIFRDSENLLELDLSHNAMDSIPDRLFENQEKLTRLNMIQNRLTTISRSIFSNLTTLIELDLSHNRIHRLDENCFASLSNLRIARLFANSIESPVNGVEILWSFASCKRLDALYLDRNKISTSNFNWILELDSLRILDLQSNFISSLEGLLNTTRDIEDTAIQYRDIRFNLINNNITEIPLTWNQSRFNIDRLSVELSVAENPFDCGCKVFNLLEHLAENARPRFYSSYRIDLGTLACNKPARMKGKRVAELNARTFSCPDESDTKNPVLCVKNCECLWRPFDYAALINCSRRLEGRSPDIFDGSRGRTIELNLIGNRLTKVPLSDTTAFKLVTKLFLSHNLISSISLADVPPQIQVLHLDHNRLKTWDAAVLEVIASTVELRELTLNSNPWNCDRNTERSLAVVAQKSKEPVTYTSDSHCIDGRHIAQREKLPRIYITFAQF